SDFEAVLALGSDAFQERLELRHDRTATKCPRSEVLQHLVQHRVLQRAVLDVAADAFGTHRTPMTRAIAASIVIGNSLICSFSQSLSFFGTWPIGSSALALRQRSFTL